MFMRISPSFHHFALVTIVFSLGIQTLQAQCIGNAQAESFTCGATPAIMYASWPCGSCTHTWAPAPASGQNTAVATYQYSYGPGWGSVTTQVSVNSYNPTIPCSYGDMWQVGVGLQPNIALPALSNGPWNGDTSKTWIYTRDYLNPGPQASGYFVFYPSWSVTGGSIVRTRNVLQGIYYHDSVLVKWNGSAAMSLHESQLTQHAPQNMVSGGNCNWTPPATPIAYPSLMVFYNGGVCTGASKTFFTFPFANSTYTWSVTNGTVVGGQGTNSAQIILNGNATVTVLRDSSGTQTTANTVVTVAASSINLGPDQTVCQGTLANFDAGPGFTQYTWSNGATTQNISVSAPGQYSVTANINGGCVAMDTVLLNTLPVTPVNLGPDVHTCSFPVILDAGPGFASYAWSTGAISQTISAPSQATYSVTVTNANGCTASDAVIVWNSQTSVNMPATQTFCFPGSANLLPTYTNASSYLWSTGSTSAGITVSSSGTQTYSVTASNVYGCQATASTTVTSQPRPTPNLGPDQTVCPGSSVTFNAGGGYSSYLWSTFNTTQTLAVTTPGTYRVTVTAANGCTGSDTVQLFNYGFVAPNLGPDINVCQPNAALNAGSGYSTYQWSTGAITQTITVNASGTYSVTVTDVNGCSGIDAINVSFNSIVMTLGPDQTVCQPQTVVLNPQLAGNFTYSWSTGATTATLTLSNPGSYNVRLAATNTFGCIARDTVLVTILPTPSINLGGDTIICADTTMTLDAGSGFTSYAWNTGPVTQSIVVTGGHYEIAATAANGCIARDSINISGMIDCVFPGDVNYDHNVDLMDVLALGSVMGVSGASRANASPSWYGQFCYNWNWSVVNSVNAKQADTDGNGVITPGDTAAIQWNFGSTHTRTGTVAGAQGQIRIVPLNPNVVGGDIARFGVYYEDANGIGLDSVYGLALQLAWPSTGLSGAGLVSVDYSNAWFAPGTNRLDFSRTDANSARLAIVRVSGTDTSGQGLLMVLSYQTDSNMAPGNAVSFAPSVIASTGVSRHLTENVPSDVVVPITVTGAVAVGPQILTHVRVWPIPANETIHVAYEGNNVRRIQLVNLMGQVVIDQITDTPGEYTLDVSRLPAGTYCLQVQTDNGLMTKNVVVARN
jgi:hypothetical protein